jgi:threonine dehydrogenase-like Zn-dependent dehydrogenase
MTNFVMYNYYLPRKKRSPRVRVFYVVPPTHTCIHCSQCSYGMESLCAMPSMYCMPVPAHLSLWQMAGWRWQVIS